MQNRPVQKDSTTFLNPQISRCTATPDVLQWQAVAAEALRRRETRQCVRGRAELRTSRPIDAEQLQPQRGIDQRGTPGRPLVVHGPASLSKLCFGQWVVWHSLCS